MDEFFNSKTVQTLSPGVAGAMTTTITATLVSQFGLPGNWTGLVLSLLFGATVWADKSAAIFQRIIFYIINSLTILAVAIGLNTAGMVVNQAVERSVDPPAIERGVPAQSPSFFQDWFK
jgi:hypothetical protein